MSEIWKRWHPKTDLKDKYYVDSIKDEDDFIIEFSAEGSEDRFILKWDGIVISYTCTDESSRSLLCDNKEITKWTFFVVENSQYSKWIEEQSLGIHQSGELVHYSIISINCVVDVVASYEPEIIQILD